MRTQLNFSQQSPVLNNKPALLLIHGWASSSRIWESYYPEFERDYCVYSFDLPGSGENRNVSCESIEEFFRLYDDAIHRALPENYAVLGWSLGGTVASLIAERHKKEVSQLITVATNISFVARSVNSYGVDKKLFDSFSFDLQQDVQRTVRRFISLQAEGVKSKVAVTRWLRNTLKQVEHTAEGLAFGLTLLRDVDLSACWRQLPMPVQHHLGARDPLVPVAVSDIVHQIAPAHRVFVYRDSGHLPFLTEKQQWLKNLGVC